MSLYGLTACDEGNITDEVFSDDTETYTVRFTGQLRGLDRWGEGYDIVLAAFDGDSDYSILQKHLTTDADGHANLVLSGVPTTAQTVELCVTNRLRQRVVTFESCNIQTAGTSTSDTIPLTLDTPLDVSMFAVIQHYVFDGAAYNCSLCHSHENGRAALDLTAGYSHDNLVGVAASRVADRMRVIPGEATSSALHDVLAEGNPAELRYDHSGLVTDVVRRLVDDWINSGAKE